jgi:transcriptional antiterminator RfaH
MKWYILYTRHQHERAVQARLAERGFQAYVPLTMEWRQAKQRVCQMARPLFPRYVFVRCYPEVYAHLELISTPGVMRFLSDAHGQLRVVAEGDIRLLGKLCESHLGLECTAYQSQGPRMEVGRGRLRGIAGIMRAQPKLSLLVPIHSLQASVAVDIDRVQLLPCAADEAAAPGPIAPIASVAR